ncbi:MAG: HAMP domain-containing sensor histidine kinase [Armatimonadota bacterium]
MVNEINNKTENIEELKAELERYRGAVKNIIHEIKAPLTSIIGYAEFILEDDKNQLVDEHKKSIEIILKNSKKICGFIDELLLLIKTCNNIIDIKFEDININHLIDNVIKNYAVCAEKKGIKIYFESFLETEVIKQDPKFLEQILANIINNAIKYTNNGYIKINTYKNDKNVVIDVEDTGIGIPEEDKKRIFEEFFQASNNKIKNNGTGLGLSIAYSLAKKINADILVESTIDKGSKFSVVLS